MKTTEQIGEALDCKKEPSATVKVTIMRELTDAQKAQVECMATKFAAEVKSFLRSEAI